MQATATTHSLQARVSFARAAALVVAAMALAVLIGWFADYAAIRSLISGAVEMKANTAVGLLLTAFALWVADGGDTNVALAGRIVAAVVVALGAATLAQYVFGWSLGIDELLVADTSRRFAAVPGRMSPLSAVSFMAIGTALAVRGPRARLPVVMGASATLVIGAVSLLGYVWRAPELTTQELFPPVAVHSAAAFVLLGAATLSTRGSSGSDWRTTTGSHELSRPVLAAFAGAVALFLFVGGYAYQATVKFADAASLVTQTELVRVTVGRVYGELSDAESAQRAYLLTGAGEYLQRFEQSSARAGETQRALAQLVSDNAEQVANAARLDSLVARRVALLAKHAATFRRSGLEGARREIVADGGIGTMRSVRALTDRMDAVERSLLDERRQSADAVRLRTLTSLLVTLFIAIAAFLVLFAGVRRAIRNRQAAERALRKSQSEFAATLRSIGDAVLETDVHGHVVRLNPVAEHLTGWTTAEAAGRPVADVFRIINEATREPGVIPVMEALASGTTHGLANHTVLVARDGAERAIADSCAPIRDETGTITGAVLVFRDVTDENAVRRALEESEAQLRDANAKLEEEVTERSDELAQSRRFFSDLFESAPDPLVVVDANGAIAMINEGAVRVFGWTREEVLGKAVELLVPEASRAAHVGHRAEYTAPGATARVMGQGRRLQGRRKDGSTFPAEISLSPIETAQGMVVAASVRDLTDRTRLEEQLRLSQKMESVGLLAGGIAHDFNNLVTIILGITELTLRELPDGDPQREEMETIHDAARRAAALTRQLLAFGRRQILQPSVVSLNEVVAGLGGMLQRLIGEHIQVSIVADPKLGAVRVDAGQIEQVLLNLAINARDAMPAGGTLSITTENVTLDAPSAAALPGLAQGMYVLLTVRDTGTGMDAATLEKVFEPFFTTKRDRGGSGLGLATAYGIVRQSGGHIGVQSAPGAGATFRIHLPRVNTAPASSRQESDAGGGRGGTETVLLVEDDDAVRHVSERILRAAGYYVKAAANAAEALAALDDLAFRADLLVTDVVMPGMSGPALAEEVARRRPGIKVLFTSGYTDDAILHHGIHDGAFHFIAKPYAVEDFRRKIRSVLDA